MGSATYEMLLSGILGALSNLCLKKVVDRQGSIFSFFLFQLLFSFLVTTYMHPVSHGSYSITYQALLLGVVCGIALGIVKYLISRALQCGPAAITFAALNCASVAPPVIYVLFCNEFIEYPYTISQAVGSFLVAAGLWWAILGHKFSPQIWKWVVLALLAFCMQTLFLAGTELCIFVRNDSLHISHSLRTYAQEFASEWFLPAIFATAFCVHMLLFRFTERRKLHINELALSILGGVLNGACTFYFVHAIETALPGERALLFPLFSVALIVTCNFWSFRLYEEKVNWRANFLCFCGLVLGSF